MRNLILTAALVSGLSFVNVAQTNNPSSNSAPMRAQMQNMTPAERAAMDANRAEKKLGLNADQKSKWQAASLERLNANEPIREKMKGSTTPQDRQQLHEQMKSNSDKFEATVSAFLTPDQKTKFDDMKSHKKGMHGGKHGMHGQPGNTNPPSGQSPPSGQ